MSIKGKSCDGEGMGATPALCAPTLLPVSGSLLLLVRLDLSLLSYHDPYSYMPAFFSAVRRVIMFCIIKGQKGPPATSTAISPLNKCLIQPLSASPKHTHASLLYGVCTHTNTLTLTIPSSSSFQLRPTCSPPHHFLLFVSKAACVVSL